MLRTERLDYQLPPDRIATQAAEPRDSARLLVVSRRDESFIEHTTVRELTRFLRSGDTLIFNQSRVLRARIQGARKDTGGRVEGLYLESVAPTGHWRMLLRSNGRLRPGMVIRLADSSGTPTTQSIRLIEKHDDAWIVEPMPSTPDPSAILESIGSTPLPPYILHARRSAGIDVPDDADRARYQTVYAAQSPESGGSVAAPTAGLHFTPELLHNLDQLRVRRLAVELSVGWGTFKPVQSEHVESHTMHAEQCAAPPDVIQTLAKTPQSGRIFAVGTTSARTLESIPEPLSQWAQSGWAGESKLLVTPGYQWHFVEGLLTNFHLPRSTLLAMVGALFPRGVDRLLEIYSLAIAEKYRFYSYGDAMLILP